MMTGTLGFCYNTAVARNVYVATLIAPKAKQLIEVWAGSDRGRGFQLFSPGCPEDCDVLGESYTADDGDPGYDTVRVHTPSGVADRGKGYGLVLYCGTALGVELLRNRDGVHSWENGRSSAADRFWGSAVRSKIAVVAHGESEETEGEIEHCEPIDDRDLDDGGVITSDEVCGNVTVVKHETRTYEVLLAENVRDSGLVLHYAKADAEVKDPPSDLLASLDLANLQVRGGGKGFAVDAKFLWRVAEIIARENIDNAKRFLRRLEVQEAVAADPKVLPIYLEFFGQKRLPGVGGLRGRGQELGVAPLIDPLPLPPASAATRRLIDRFADVPDPGAE